MIEKKNIYIFCGLGADESVFEKLDFTNYTTYFIKWEPIVEDITIAEYAKQLVCQIEDKEPILLGLSFGGMIAIEIAKQIETKMVIIISSIKTRKEIPPYYRFAGKLNLHKLVSAKILQKANRISEYLFGAKTLYEKLLLEQVLHKTDPHFLKWAIDKIVKWENETYPSNLCHIHGSKDRILPCRFVNPDYKIKSGGHFMIISKSQEIMKVLDMKLSTI